MIKDLTPAEQLIDDRNEYLRFNEAANELRTMSRLMASFAVNAGAEANPKLHTFSVGVLNYIRARRDQDAAWFAEQADDAQQIADHYRARLGLDDSGDAA